MKLNYKRTLLVGFAFFLICTFWQAYDTIIPKILTDRFGMSQTLSGIIMALDNILALFLLPMFGKMSDNCTHRWGRRKPFVFYGTVAAVLALMLITAADAAQLGMIKDATAIDDPDALAVIYDELKGETVSTPDGVDFVLSERYTKEEFTAVKSSIYQTKVSADKIILTTPDGGKKTLEPGRFKTTFVTYDGNTFYWRNRDTQLDTEINPLIIVIDGDESTQTDLAKLYAGENYDCAAAFKAVTNAAYTNYVVPARQLHISKLTKTQPLYLIFFIVVLMILLLAMSVFRSPAVALMPDVTVKPLRSKANAVINLMGTVGGVLVLLLGMGFAFNNSAIANTFRPYVGFFGAVAGIMTFALICFMLFVKEPEWNADMLRESAEKGYDTEEEADDKPQGKKKKSGFGSGLTRGELLSLILILASVAFWYFGYNAVTSKYSVYATNVLDLDYSSTLLIANAAAIVSYLPAGMLASKLGRKKIILAGVVMLALAFGVASFMRVGAPAIIMNILFALAGMGWAAINVNSFPMVVELSKNGDIGRYTGYYYAASMAAQAFTPFLSGMVMDNFGMTSLLPYSTVFVCLAFVTMLFVKHGDSKPEKPADKLAAFADNDP